MPRGAVDGQLSTAAKAALLLETDLVIAGPGDLSSDDLQGLAAEIGKLAELIAEAYFV